MISLKQLRHALAVEKTLHFKKAADLCHVSQSALSTSLAELESQLKLKIFERNNKKVMITPIGSEVLERARNVMVEIEDIQQLATSQSSPLSLPLKLGAIPTIAPFLLPKMIPMLNKEHPEAKIDFVEEQSATLIDMVREGHLDVAVLALPYPIEGLLALEFWHEDFYVVGNKAAEHLENKEQIRADEIDTHHLLLMKDGHCLKDQILDVCRFDSSKAKYSVKATSLNTLVQMVISNMGTTLVPAMAIEQLVSQSAKLVTARLNEPSPHRRLALIFRPNYTRIKSLELLSDLCKRSLQD